MRPSFHNAVNAIENVLLSRGADSFSNAFKVVAALGGFILSVDAFISPIASMGEIYVAIFAPLVTLIILTSKNYIKATYFAHRQTQLAEEKQIATQAVNYLHDFHNQKRLRAQVGQDTLQILQLLNQNPAQFSYTNEQLQKMILRKVEETGTKDEVMKYTIGGIDLATSLFAGSAAVFINFIMPMVLKDMMDNKELRIIALSFAALYAMICGMTSLATTHREWTHLQKEKEVIQQKLNELSNLYRAHPDASLHSPTVTQALSLWTQSALPALNEPNPAVIPAPALV